MAQKIISFEVAKALKEAGYPQECKDGTIYYAENGLKWKYDSETYDMYDDPVYCICPTYLDAWLWLWREKEIRICLEDAKNPKEPEIERGCYIGTNQLGGICSSQEFADPEDAIVDIIDYLVDNDLIK